MNCINYASYLLRYFSALTDRSSTVVYRKSHLHLLTYVCTEKWRFLTKCRKYTYMPLSVFAWLRCLYFYMTGLLHRAEQYSDTAPVCEPRPSSEIQDLIVCWGEKNVWSLVSSSTAGGSIKWMMGDVVWIDC